MIELLSGVDISNLIDDIRILSWQAADILLYYSKLLESTDNKRNIVSAINLFINNLNSFKKNIENLDDRTLRKKLINSKKVRQQILSLKQDIAKPDFGRDQD